MAEKGYERTRNSMRNSVVALSLQFVAMLLGFFTRKIFIDYLGTELLGLSSTVGSLLGFLNLAELGISSAITVTLYKPIFEHDTKAIREIVALQGWLYRVIACTIIVAGTVLMLFFPSIFAKADVPVWYPYITFICLMYSNLLGYFVNYKIVVVDAHQHNYKIQLRSRLVNMGRQILQALAVWLLSKKGYPLWVALDAVAATISCILLQRLVKKEYPYLDEKVANPWALRTKYPGILTKVGQLFCHRIGGFAQGQISPVIIYACCTLSTVGMYGNYCVLTANLGYLLSAMFDGVQASVGNMVAEGDKKLIMRVFRELFSSRFTIAGVCCICLYLLAEPFVSLWIGPEYILNRNTLIIMIAMFFITNTRSAVESFLNAYGMFRDIWAPLVETTVSVGLSILLGRLFGLSGVLCGSLVSLILIVLIWKPIFLFHWGLKEPLGVYIGLYLKHLLILVASFAAVIPLAGLLPIDPAQSLPAFLVYALAVFAASVIVTGGLAWMTETGFRSFVSRTYSVIRNR